MAEPIRRVAPPARRRPLQAVRPQARLRPVLWTGDENRSAPLSQLRTAPPEPAQPPLAQPAANASRTDTQTRPWTQAFQPVAEKKLRTFLLAALALHGAALALPFLLPSLPAPSLSETLLASAVLTAGSAILALGALGRRAG